ncbi:hypothetical protein DE146DRAFT_110279 [Phaeosphaeria sp. MPI-PUGE-AT-0046c]|nr:hypothetical protein DE146DRAFT_110279 [Phaeosphaeria sp. MPI-PUGE-AT-0046c]
MSSLRSSSKPRTSTYITDQAQIASYNRGPITSRLALPASCTQTLTYISNLYFGHYSSVFDTACVATGTLDSAQLAPGSAWAKYYYSPAICPPGWTVAATFSKCFEVVPLDQCLSLGPETSAGLCCPSGYTSYRSGHQCASTITSGQDVTFIAPSLVGLGWETGTPVTNMATETAIVKGDGIPIWWQSTDASMLSAAAAQTPSSMTVEVSKTGGGLVGEPTGSSSSTSASAASSPDISSTAVGESSGLSTGTKAGIGVGVSVGVIVIGLLMGFFFWRRRRSRSKKVGELPVQLGNGNGGGKFGPSVYQRQEMNPVYPRQEMDGETRHELPGSGYK